MTTLKLRQSLNMKEVNIALFWHEPCLESVATFDAFVSS